MEFKRESIKIPSMTLKVFFRRNQNSTQKHLKCTFPRTCHFIRHFMTVHATFLSIGNMR